MRFQHIVIKTIEENEQKKERQTEKRYQKAQLVLARVTGYAKSD